MFNFGYAQIIKISTNVSLQTTTTSESTVEGYNTKQVSASSWLQTLLTLFPAGEIKIIYFT